MKIYNLECDFEVNDLNFDLTEDTQVYNIDFGVITERQTTDYYDGPYTVTPRIYAQELDIKEKTARQDIQIEEIPTYEVDNTKGTTFYIGDKLNGN